MVSHSLHSVVNHLRQAVRPRDSLVSPDCDLLQRFARLRDEAAFEELVRRHGPMVLRVSQRILRGEQDAEDVFQATFLTLARKVGTIRKGASVGCWLHGVARYLALRMRREAARREMREANETERTTTDPLDEVSIREAQAMLDEELARLPERLRAPLVLCYLEGNTRDEAARRLGLSLATLKRQLESGRERLRGQLTRRGLTLSAALLSALVDETAIAALPVGLTAQTVSAALRFLAGGLDIPGATLAMRALHNVAASKAKLATGLVIVLSLIATGAGLAVRYPRSAMETQGEQTATAQEQPKTENRAANIDVYGDPLPPGAIRRLGTVQFRQPYLRQVAFSADGKSVIATGQGGVVRQWDVATGKLIRRTVLRVKKEGELLQPQALSPDGKIAVMSTHGGSLHLCNTATGEPLLELSAGTPRPGFTPDGKLLAVPESDFRDGKPAPPIVRVWDVTARKIRTSLTMKESFYVQYAVISPDGKTVATLGSNVGLCLWNATNGKLLRQVRVEGFQPQFSRDGKLLALARPNGEVGLYAADTGEERGTLKSPDEDSVYSLCFLPDNKTLAVAGHRWLIFWDVAAAKESRRLKVGDALDMAISPDGKTLALGEDSAVVLLDVATGKNLHERPGHCGSAGPMCVSADGTRLATSSGGDHGLGVWDIASGRAIFYRSNLETAWPIPLHFSAGGAALVCDTRDGYLRLVEATTGQERKKYTIRNGENRIRNYHTAAARLTADGKELVALSVCGDEKGEFQMAVNVWDIDKGEPAASRTINGGRFGGLTPDGQRMVRWTAGGLVFEEVATGRERWTLAGEFGRLMSFSSDCNFLAVAALKPSQPRHPHATVDPADDNRVEAASIIELATGKEVLRIRTGLFTHLEFSSDARLLATDGSGPFQLWDAVTGQRILEKWWPKEVIDSSWMNFISAQAFLPDGKTLATGMMDGTILIWDLEPATWRKRTPSPEPGPKELEVLWADLAGSDAGKAYRALHTLREWTRRTIPFFKDHLLPAKQVDASRVEALLGDLDNEQFALRETASKALESMGEAIVPRLQRALDVQPSPEARKRIKAILAKVASPSDGEIVRALRAITVLERIGTAEARDLLRKLADGAPTLPTREAKIALERMKTRP